jgi:D-sedoheptulose 7-phosphate isomerase
MPEMDNECGVPTAQKDLLNDLIERYPDLTPIKRDILDAYHILEQAYLKGRKVLVAGNGGSAADAEHIVGELMKGFVRLRPIDSDLKQKLLKVDKTAGHIVAKNLQGTLPTISLVGHPALGTACQNDIMGEMVFAQQVFGYGIAGDVFLALSTSGNSKNIYYAALTARALDLKVLALTGRNGGILAQISNVVLKIPESETYKVQERHLPLYHCLCRMLEERFTGEFWA